MFETYFSYLVEKSALSHFATIKCYFLKDQKESDFISAWKAVADLYYRYAGSFGARLHKINESKYCVYTLWPDQDTFKQAEKRLPVAALALQAKLKSCCTKVEAAMEMGVLIDQIHLSTYPSL